MQDQPSIERYLRQGEVWISSETTDLDAVVPLESIECALKLGEVYDKVMFDTENRS